MRHCQSALSAAGFRDGLGFLLHLVCNGDIKLEITCDYVKPAKHCKGIRHTAVFQHHAACCHKQICGCGRHAPARRQRRLALSSTWGPSQKRGKKGRAFFPRSHSGPLARHPVMRAVNPRGIPTRCLLTRHPFRLSTLPGDFEHCGQAVGAFTREQGRFCILR